VVPPAQVLTTRDWLVSRVNGLFTFDFAE
jgi:hypothetical protein